jgi:hypothetical protein
MSKVGAYPCETPLRGLVRQQLIEVVTDQSSHSSKWQLIKTATHQSNNSSKRQLIKAAIHQI